MRMAQNFMGMVIGVLIIVGILYFAAPEAFQGALRQIQEWTGWLQTNAPQNAPVVPGGAP